MPYTIMDMARPKIDLNRHGETLSERVALFAKENGLRKDRAWAELVALGLDHKDEFDATSCEKCGGLTNRTEELDGGEQPIYIALCERCAE